MLWDNGQDNRVFQQDAQSLAEELRETGQTLDIAYLDPPYNQHPYGSNYHILNALDSCGTAHRSAHVSLSEINPPFARTGVRSAGLRTITKALWMPTRSYFTRSMPALS